MAKKSMGPATFGGKVTKATSPPVNLTGQKKVMAITPPLPAMKPPRGGKKGC